MGRYFGERGEWGLIDRTQDFLMGSSLDLLIVRIPWHVLIRFSLYITEFEETFQEQHVGELEFPNLMDFQRCGTPCIVGEAAAQT